MRQALRIQTTSNSISRDLSTMIKSNNINMYSTQVSGCTLPGNSSAFQSPDLLDEKLFNLKLRCGSSPQSPRFPTLHSSRLINHHEINNSNDDSWSYHAVSPAQLERFKSNYPKVSNLLNQKSTVTSRAAASQVNSDNLELIQRLEKLTYKYNTSVPVIISSWLSNGNNSNGIKVKLNEHDVDYLNESISF